MLRLSMICFAAHPDDETIGAGGQLAWWRDVWIVHVTDGSPRNRKDASREGFLSSEAYARARRREVLDALQIVGIVQERVINFHFVDQECCWNLVSLVEHVCGVLLAIQPKMVLVPPYEGGHPDHDSLAFAVHAACRLFQQRGLPIPALVEHTLYHAEGERICTASFLPCPDSTAVELRLNDRARLLKRQMLDCFVTQRATLAPFDTAVESFRLAPHYDFTLAPHPGKLYYEQFDWGITGEDWRKLAVAAMNQMGVGRG